MKRFDRIIWTVCRPIRVARRVARRLRQHYHYARLWAMGWVKLNQERKRYGVRGQRFALINMVTISPMGTPMKIFAAPIGEDRPRILRVTALPDDDGWFLMRIPGNDWNHCAILHGSFPCLVQPFEEWEVWDD